MTVDSNAHYWTVFIAGLQGSGKTTVAEQLASVATSETSFLDADDFHSAAARDAMRLGKPVDGESLDYRTSWLDRVLGACWLETLRRRNVVCSCSLLTQALRLHASTRTLPEEHGWRTTRLVLWLEVPEEELRRRLALRDAQGNHFAGSTLLCSQIKSAELPTTNESRYVFKVDGTGDEQTVLKRARIALRQALKRATP